jgi:hypothetical protein
MTNRLGLIIQKVIAHTQTAFIEDRFTIEGIYQKVIAHTQTTFPNQF